MKLAKTSLKILSYVEILIGVFYLVLAVLALVGSPIVNDMLSEVQVEGVDVKLVAVITFVVSALFSFLYAYLMQVAIKDGKKTTLLLVLLAIGILGGIRTIIGSFSIVDLITLALDVFILVQVLTLRKAAK